MTRPSQFHAVTQLTSPAVVAFTNILYSHLVAFTSVYRRKLENCLIFPILTLWPESASELYRLSNRHLSAKLVPTFVARGCHVVSMTDPYGCILCFLDSLYFPRQLQKIVTQSRAAADSCFITNDTVHMNIDFI
jgi:hypothetical protein